MKKNTKTFFQSTNEMLNKLNAPIATDQRALIMYAVMVAYLAKSSSDKDELINHMHLMNSTIFRYISSYRLDELPDHIINELVNTKTHTH